MTAETNIATGLKSFVRVMSGPRCLRSALRQKTEVCQRLLTVLSSPVELQVSIPVSVFGGDIFSVMSEQLRDALVVPPPAGGTVVNANRRRSMLAPESGASSFSKNLLPLATQHTRSTLPSESLASPNVLKEPAWAQTAPSRNSARVSPESLAPSAPISADQFRQAAVRSRTPTREAATFPNANHSSNSTKAAATAPAFVNSLNRYFQLLGETRDTTRANPATVSTDTPITRRDVAAADAASDSEQQAAARTWPTFVGRELSEKLRTLNDTPGDQSKLSTTTPRLNSPADHQIQNVFNIEVKNENQPGSGFDDLADRIAEILNEQALHHGIDVT